MTPRKVVFIMKKSMDENNLFEPETVISASDENNVRSRWGNLALKILAVLGAFLIWLYAEAMDDPNYTRDFVGIPVTITNNAPNGLTVVSGSNYMVNITVQGNRKMVEELTYEDVEAFVDISDILFKPRRNGRNVERKPAFSNRCIFFECAFHFRKAFFFCGIRSVDDPVIDTSCKSDLISVFFDTSFNIIFHHHRIDHINANLNKIRNDLHDVTAGVMVIEHSQFMNVICITFL